MIQLTHRITFLSIKLTCHIYRRLGNTPLSLSLPVSLPLLLSLSILFTLSLSFYLSFFLFFLSILTKREIREKRESEYCVTSNSVELIVHECRLLLKTQTIIWKQNILVSFLHSHILYFLEEIKTSLQRTLPARFFFFWCFLSQSTITKTVLNDRINDGVKHYQMSIFSSNVIIGKNNKYNPFSCFAIDCGFFIGWVIF